MACTLEGAHVLWRLPIRVKLAQYPLSKADSAGGTAWPTSSHHQRETSWLRAQSQSCSECGTPEGNTAHSVCDADLTVNAGHVASVDQSCTCRVYSSTCMLRMHGHRPRLQRCHQHNICPRMTGMSCKINNRQKVAKG